jgi:hypothetical protein
MSMIRITAWMATTVTLVALTADAQPSRRSVQSSLRDERGFATELQRAVRMGDRDAVAGLLRYPARVSVKQRPYPIFVKDRASLVDMYDLVFTPHLRCAIVESREPAQGEARPKHSLLLARGVVSLADGRIVAERSRGKYQITRMSSFGDTSTRLGRPRPVTFAAGQRQVELGGRVAEAGADAYVVLARAGVRLQAAIRGFPAGSLSLRVSRRGSDAFLDGAAREGSTWAARLNEGGEYLVEVVRRAPYCEPPVISHLLTLSLTGQ